MKNTFWKLVILVFIGSLVSCSFLFDNKSETGQHENSQTGTNATISSQYWGTWIQMDTGTEYYIDNQDIYKLNSGSKTKIQSGISGYILESDEVLKKDNTVFFRKGGKTRSFSTTISGFSHSTNNSVRAASSISGEIRGKRKNQENSADVETVVSTDGITVQFKGGVADDSQVVTISQGEESGTATVNPKYDGENMGSIPIVEAGKYAFKTTYVVSNADSQGFMYGNNLGVYNISFNITNIGEETCATSVYSISWTDTNLSSSDLVREGNFTSIGPGNAKEIKGSFIYGYFDEEYKDVTISISITDSKYEKTWNDYVTLRFYRGWVNFKVNARNFNQSSNAKLNGFIVYPDGRSKRFTVSSGNSATVSVPWSKKDYYIVLSGANNDTEMCYSFVATEFGEPSDLSGVWSIADINAYESNDTIQTATLILNFTSPVKAYLKNGDIDYYKFNTSELICSKGGLKYSGHKFSDSTSISSSMNNKDGRINPGEIIWMDVKIHNSIGKKIQEIVVKASSESEYVTFNTYSANYGDIDSGYYQCYHGAKYYYSDVGWSIDTMDYYDVTNEAYVPFKFSISSECPVETEIPINLTITDKDGNEWTDSFSINVVKENVLLEYCSYELSYYNGPVMRAGTSRNLGITIRNNGTSMAKSVQVIISTDHTYLEFINSSVSYGDIGSNSSKTESFTLQAVEDFPLLNVIPMNIVIRDNQGNEWTKTFTITN